MVGVNVQRSSSTFNTTTEVPLSKAPNYSTAPRAPQHKWLPTAPGVCSQCVCSLLCVCNLDGLNAEPKFRVWVTILGRMSRNLTWRFDVKKKLGGTGI